jgi:septal ring factor EnvC (AmiA/AmiB activator)
MKLSELKQLILESLQEDNLIPSTQENIEEPMKFEGMNQIKDFYVVSKPNPEMRESTVRKANVFDEILMEDTHGVYMSQAEATREAKRLTQEYMSQLQELEKTMEEVRAQKKELEERRKEAAEKLAQMKGKTKKDKK